MLMHQFSKFAVIGVLGFLVDSATLLVVTRLVSLDLYSGRVLSFLAAVTTTWALNRTFTFKDARSASYVREWLRFLLFNAVGGALNFAIYAYMVHEVASLRERPIIAVACGCVVGLFANFSFSKLFVFRSVRAHSPR